MFKPADLQRIRALAEAAHPSEACGLFVGTAWENARLVELDNLQDRYHERDPVRFPRTSRTAYTMHPLRLNEAIEAGGGLLCVWHSHCDVGAYFSDEDVRVALGGGDEPLWPGTTYLVVSSRDHHVDGARLFAWNAATKQFDGVDVPMPAAGS